jgi:hypothetical protein
MAALAASTSSARMDPLVSGRRRHLGAVDADAEAADAPTSGTTVSARSVQRRRKWPAVPIACSRMIVELQGGGRGEQSVC